MVSLHREVYSGYRDYCCYGYTGLAREDAQVVHFQQPRFREALQALTVRGNFVTLLSRLIVMRNAVCLLCFISCERA